MTRSPKPRVIIRQGNSDMLTIPKEVMDKLGLHTGDKITCRAVGKDKMVMVKAEPTQPTPAAISVDGSRSSSMGDEGR